MNRCFPLGRSIGLRVELDSQFRQSGAYGGPYGCAGGSLENGAPTVTLTRNKALTLMNTADGTRYVLRLVSVS